MHDHQNTFARNLPFQRAVTEQVGSKLFPLSTIIFTLDVLVIITFPSMIRITDYTREMKLFHKIGFSSHNNLHICV